MITFVKHKINITRKVATYILIIHIIQKLKSSKYEKNVNMRLN